MLCYKFRTIILCLFILSSAFAEKFNSEQCMQSVFETKIKNSGQYFGLLKNELTIKKDICNFEIHFLKMKWVADKIWKVDICREPIHIKVFDKGSESFHKRIENCVDKADNSFCSNWDELKENLEDYGLIYAEGERESLSTAHGQTYCSYLLLKKYLDGGFLFSKFDKPHSLFSIEVQQETKSFEQKEMKRDFVMNEGSDSEKSFLSVEETKPVSVSETPADNKPRF